MNLRFQRLVAALLPPVLVPKAWSAVYDNAQNSPRRGQVPGAAPRDAKKDLTAGTRRELVRRSRYLYKNSGFVRELVSSMAIYSTGDGIRPQAQSPDPDWNQRAEDYFKRWSAHCEITGRFSFEECQGSDLPRAGHRRRVFRAQDAGPARPAGAPAHRDPPHRRWRVRSAAGGRRDPRCLGRPGELPPAGGRGRAAGDPGPSDAPRFRAGERVGGAGTPPASSIPSIM